MTPRLLTSLLVLGTLAAAVPCGAAETGTTPPAPGAPAETMNAGPAPAPGDDWLAVALLGGGDELLAADDEAGDPPAAGGHGPAFGGSRWRGQGGPGWHGMGPGQRRGPGGGAGLASRLELTPSQRDRMEEIRDRERRHAIQARADLQIARLDLRRLMRAEHPDAHAIDAQIDKLAHLRAEMAKSRVASLLEARAVLTPEQQQKLREWRMNPPRERGEREGRDGGRDGGDDRDPGGR